MCTVGFSLVVFNCTSNTVEMLGVCWVFVALLCAAVLALFLTRYALTSYSEAVLSSLYDSTLSNQHGKWAQRDGATVIFL